MTENEIFYGILDLYVHAKLRIKDMEEHIHSLNQIIARNKATIARLEEELDAAREEQEDD